MKKLLLVILYGFLIMACNQSPKQSYPSVKQVVDNPRDGVFIHISQGYNDPHRVLMALKMATIMSEDKDVIVYMDVNAVQLMVKGAADVVLPDFESAQTYLKVLLDQKIGVFVCPTCLKSAGYTPDDLIKGAQVANKEKFFNFTEGRFLTVDY